MNPIFRIIGVDTETTGRAPEPHFPATPSFEKNAMLCAGFVEGEKKSVVRGRVGPYKTDHLLTEFVLSDTLRTRWLLVGHNLAFDLQVLSRELQATRTGGIPFWFGINDQFQVWDTMVAHYVITGQDTGKQTLEDVSKYWGVPYVKDPSIVSIIESGQLESFYFASIENAARVEKYMLADAQAAVDIARRQMDHVQAASLSGLNQYPLMAAMQDMVLVKAAMEETGVPFSIDAASEQAKALAPVLEGSYNDVRAQLVALAAGIYGRMGGALPSAKLAAWAGQDEGYVPSNDEIVSPSFLKRVFYQAELTLVYKTPKTFKNGTTKMVNATKVVPSIPLVSASMLGEKDWPKTPKGEPALNEKALDLIGQRIGAAGPLVKALEEVRRVQKLLGTYFEALPRWALWSTVLGSYTIHTQYNLTITSTGRLSSSSPNLQNPPPEAKLAFVAPKGWHFIEIDYQQLEVVGLAILSGDEQLQDDIRNGRDIHTVLFYEMYGKMPTKSERKAFKPLTFGLIYGAGDSTLSSNSGQPIMVVKKFRKTFFGRYPKVQEWYNYVRQTVELSRIPSGQKSSSGVPVGKSKFPLFTGRLLTFTEQDIPWEPGKVSFAPSDLANWPVQSFATADVVPTMLGVFARKLWSSNHRHVCRLIGTTHDSLLLLVEDGYREAVWNFSYHILSKTSETIGRYFGKKIDVPLNVSGAAGNTWAACGDEANALTPPISATLVP